MPHVSDVLNDEGPLPQLLLVLYPHALHDNFCPVPLNLIIFHGQRSLFCPGTHFLHASAYLPAL